MFERIPFHHKEFHALNTLPLLVTLAPHYHFGFRPHLTHLSSLYLYLYPVLSAR